MAEKKTINLFHAATLDQIPTGKVGDPITADWMNRGIEGLNRLTGHVDAPQQVIRPRSTARPSEGGDRVVAVSLVGFLDGPLELDVRRVKLSQPVDFLGDSFPASADFGQSAVAYSPFLFTDPTPTNDTPYLVARKEGSTWFVELPSVAEERIVAVGIRSPFPLAPTPSGPAFVGRIRYETFPPSFPASGSPTQLEWMGTTFPAHVDFGQRPEDYTGLTHAGARPDENKPIVFARKEGAVWFVEVARATRATQFQVVQNFGDYVSAKQFIRGLQVGALTLIAKPWDVRKTPFDGNTIDGIEYTYENDHTRLAENVREDKERQFITPAYNADALIYATQDPLHGTNVVTQTAHGNIVAGTAVTWLAEVDGRKYAWDGEDITP